MSGARLDRDDHTIARAESSCAVAALQNRRDERTGVFHWFCAADVAEAAATQQVNKRMGMCP